jgi:hypothetical protein
MVRPHLASILISACPKVCYGSSRAQAFKSLRTFSTTAVGHKYTHPTIKPEEEKFIIKSPYSDVEIPEVSLADFVWKDVEKWEDNVALVCGLTGRQYTYGMAYGMARKFGSSLLRMGAKKGDVLGMVVPNIPEFPIAFLGACVSVSP